MNWLLQGQESCLSGAIFIIKGESESIISVSFMSSWAYAETRDFLRSLPGGMGAMSCENAQCNFRKYVQQPACWNVPKHRPRQ